MARFPSGIVHLKGPIRPKICITGGYKKKITEIDESLVVRNVRIFVNDGHIESVKFSQEHPNRDPKTGLFCLPDYLEGVEYNPEYKETIIKLIEKYHVDSCYVVPWSRFKIENSEND